SSDTRRSLSQRPRAPRTRGRLRVHPSIICPRSELNSPPTPKTVELTASQPDEHSCLHSYDILVKRNCPVLARRRNERITLPDEIEIQPIRYRRIRGRNVWRGLSSQTGGSRAQSVHQRSSRWRIAAAPAVGRARAAPYGHYVQRLR